jgi:hypothetical protein
MPVVQDNMPLMNEPGNICDANQNYTCTRKPNKAVMSPFNISTYQMDYYEQQTGIRYPISTYYIPMQDVMPY